jgi:aminopeptidase N
MSPPGSSAVAKRSAAEHGATTAGDPYLPRHGNGGYLVEHYDLDLHYRVADNRLAGRARIDAITTQRLSRLSLDLHGLAVDRVRINGRPAARYRQNRGKLHIWPESDLARDALVRINVRYGGVPTPMRGRWGAIGWDELVDGVIVAGQPNGAPSWFPCNDHPSNKATFRVAVTTDAAYRVVGNGELVDKRSAGPATQWVYRQREPMATYLATLQIGRYEVVKLATGPTPVRLVLPRGLKAAAGAAFRRQVEMLSFFECSFGPYPFHGYTVVVTADRLDIPVEAQGLSIFGSNHVDGYPSAERLIAHELAHQWFGNSVSVSSWRHIWLNEGFARFAEWLWAAESGGPSLKQSAAAAFADLRRMPRNIVIGDPGPDLLFDERVSLRGALTLVALRRQLGSKAFTKVIRDWVSGRRHATAGTEDFIALAAGEGADPRGFKSWLFTAELPASGR